MFLWQIRKYKLKTGNEQKHPCGGYTSRKERRERGVLIPLLFTLTLEKSQVSLRRENAENTERAEIYGIAYVINVFFIYLYGQSMIMLYEGRR